MSAAARPAPAIVGSEVEAGERAAVPRKPIPAGGGRRAVLDRHFTLVPNAVIEIAKYVGGSDFKFLHWVLRDSLGWHERKTRGTTTIAEIAGQIGVSIRSVQTSAALVERAGLITHIGNQGKRPEFHLNPARPRSMMRSSSRNWPRSGCRSSRNIGRKSAMRAWIRNCASRNCKSASSTNIGKKHFLFTTPCDAGPMG